MLQGEEHLPEAGQGVEQRHADGEAAGVRQEGGDLHVRAGRLQGWLREINFFFLKFRSDRKVVCCLAEETKRFLDVITKRRVATLPGILEKLQFDNLGKKPVILTIFICSVVKFGFDSKSVSYK